VTESPIAVFDKLTRVDLPERTPVLFDTACVLGGSIAGLLAARVLADHARTVLIIERDQVKCGGTPACGCPPGSSGAWAAAGRARADRALATGLHT
jgi:pyruvate/2-oxoglutarate dehydrogenase complex dihydrolipoamide dehydrogenase (E3) component